MKIFLPAISLYFAVLIAVLRIGTKLKVGTLNLEFGEETFFVLFVEIPIIGIH